MDNRPIGAISFAEIGEIIVAGEAIPTFHKYRNGQGLKMPELVVTKRSGEEIRIEAPSGLSLMQALCEAGFDELLALCGGVCSCATCHVYVSGGAWSTLSPMGEDENNLLDGSSYRQEASRLSCQILLTDDFDGLRVAIAPED